MDGWHGAQLLRWDEDFGSDDEKDDKGFLLGKGWGKTEDLRSSMKRVWVWVRVTKKYLEFVNKLICQIRGYENIWKVMFFLKNN